MLAFISKFMNKDRLETQGKYDSYSMMREVVKTIQVSFGFSKAQAIGPGAQGGGVVGGSGPATSLSTKKEHR